MQGLQRVFIHIFWNGLCRNPGGIHRSQHRQKSLALQVGQARMNRAVIPAKAGIQYPACERRTSGRIASRFQTWGGDASSA